MKNFNILCFYTLFSILFFYESNIYGDCSCGRNDIKIEENGFNDEILVLPHLYFYEDQYKNLKNEVDYRFEKYFREKEFAIFAPGRSDESIKEEFMQLRTLRWQTWFDTNSNEIERNYREDFIPFFALIREDMARTPNCISFDYNKVSPYFNGSLIEMNGYKFLALEAPMQKNVNRFYYTLLDTNASLLVRLTPEVEKGVEKCFPYWKNHFENGKLLIPRSKNLPKSIDYIYADNWEDSKGTNLDFLLNFVLHAREIYNPSKGPLAVHCVGGVGRTGVFIAAFCMFDEIDEQLRSGKKTEDVKVSIEKIVARLSLQRYHMVAKPDQYLSLYQLAAKYIEMVTLK
ncbi:MAG: protein-tyrosine phosphatase family protein [Parachlamydiales bacterium]|jgi:protein tyrosine phosphatase